MFAEGWSHQIARIDVACELASNRLRGCQWCAGSIKRGAPEKSSFKIEN